MAAAEGERLKAAEGAPLVAAEPDSAQASPPRLPGAWTSLTSQEKAAVFQHWSTITRLDAGIAADCPAPDQADVTAAARTPATADDQTDVVAAECCTQVCPTCSGPEIEAAGSTGWLGTGLAERGLLGGLDGRGHE